MNFLWLDVRVLGHFTVYPWADTCSAAHSCQDLQVCVLQHCIFHVAPELLLPLKWIMHNISNRDVICEQRPGLLHLQACLIQCVGVVDIHFLLYSLSGLSFTDAPQLFWDMDLMCTCLNRHYLPLQQILPLVRSKHASTSSMFQSTKTDTQNASCHLIGWG